MTGPSTPNESLPPQRLPRLVLTAPLVDAVHTLRDRRDTLRAFSPSSDAVPALTEAIRLVLNAMMTASVDTEWVPIMVLADKWGVPQDTVLRWAARGLITAERRGRRWFAPLTATPPRGASASEGQ